MNDEERQRGAATFEQVMGFAPPQGDDPFLNVTLEHLFARIWTRGQLSRRERRLITLTAVACLGHEPTLRLHLRAAQSSGDLSDADIDELILHIAHYAGWPAANVVSGAVRRLRAEGHQPTDKR